MRRFNVTGLCTPEEDYMVDISGKIEHIKQLIDGRCYFTMNRARQYGKTTTLNMLRKTLANEYMCINLSFEGVGPTMFLNAQSFCQRFLWQIDMAAEHVSYEKLEWQNDKVTDFDELSVHLTQLCFNRKIVLMIDEVDKASNHEVFLHFLGMLRNKFNARKSGIGATFHSVILAGVYDIKNIKSKMMREGKYQATDYEDKKYDSPWNIAVDFDIDMSFNPAEISTMLKEYESDHCTGMDIEAIAGEIHSYTSGYPFLVSRICQCIDEKLKKDWTGGGVQNAVKVILDETNTLFDDIFKSIGNYEELRKYLYDLLFIGMDTAFNIDNEIIKLGCMFGFLKKANGKTRVANKIFETRIYNYFVSHNEVSADNNIRNISLAKYEVLKKDGFDMELCLRKFAQHYNEIFSGKDIEFLERHGRLLFLSYLRPFINGDGFYHVESEINDFRMDVVVDYKSEQFIVELKIWRGEKYEQMAYEQLANYLKIKNAQTGYLLTFDFRKETNKGHKADWLEIDGRKIFELII